MLLSLGKDFLGDIITGTGDVESDQDRRGKVKRSGGRWDIILRQWTMYIYIFAR